MRLFRLAALDRVWVEADVYEDDLPLLEVGQRAAIALPHSRVPQIFGSVDYVYPSLDQTLRVGKARIELPNPDEVLKPGMYADALIRVPLGNRLLVPDEAVIYHGRGTPRVFGPRRRPPASNPGVRGRAIERASRNSEGPARGRPRRVLRKLLDRSGEPDPFGRTLLGEL